MTFSIVACDLDAADGAEWGVAVASKFLAVGSVVPWARAGAGALATQAYANVAYGPQGLDGLAGAGAESVLGVLTAGDDGRAHRQVGIVDRLGGSASFTGEECYAWAGGRIGPGYACQGNILTGPEVVDAMVDAFEGYGGVPLEDRLMAALQAGDLAGGDSRGRQSSALLVVREGGGYLGGTDVAIDLRVDDHPDPMPELQRILDVHNLLFPRPSALEFIEIDEAVAAEIRRLLTARGLLAEGTSGGYDDALQGALQEFVGVENLELRWSDHALIERAVLAALRGRPGGNG